MIRRTAMRTISLLIVAVLICAGFCKAQIAHWPLDNDVNDATGSFHGEMTPDGVYFFNDPVRGQVMWLDGFQGYVTLPAGLLAGIQDVTITCWFNWAGGDVWQRVYSFGNAMPSVRTLYLCPQDGWEPHQLHITLGGQPPGGAFVWKDYTPQPIVPEVWYFTALILKGDSLKFYLDDQLLIHEGDVLVNPEDLLPDNSNFIGKSHWDDPAQNLNDPKFSGLIDDMRFYSRALTGQEILELYLATSVRGTENRIRQFSLNQNYPNPFNPVTHISYEIPGDGPVSLKIINLRGEEVAVLVDEFQKADIYEISFDASDLAAGIYIYRLSSNQDLIQTRQMVLLK
jgi:hypothetical protein